MIIRTQKIVEETHELELPAYRKNICYYYKIINEKEAIQVNFSKSWPEIGITCVSVALNTALEIGNEEEFEEKFNDVMMILNDKK